MIHEIGLGKVVFFFFWYINLVFPNCGNLFKCIMDNFQKCSLLCMVTS